MPIKSMGQFIAALRKANGLTQQDVADRLNVSNKAVSRWEMDETAPDIMLLPALAEMFGISCDELIRCERNTADQPITDGAKMRTEKQLKAFIASTLGKFETLSLIALLLSATGFFLMLGASYAFSKPLVGFTLMLIFEAGALTLTAIAAKTAFRNLNENELIESVDEDADQSFKTDIGKRFFAFYLLLSAFSFFRCRLRS